MDRRGSESMLGTLLEGTLRYEDARLPTVDMDDLSERPARRVSRVKQGGGGGGGSSSSSNSMDASKSTHLHCAQPTGAAISAGHRGA